ncbi:RNA binding protein [Arthrobacter phage Jamun]|nr:RNA binding protein [Arthrobacter phage Basilisk]UXE05151.1 RNA binding protein [Arthrobacter phage Jamun]WNM69452.1 RNA binding protein [Arthrobacter phage Ruchi]
MEIVAVVYGFAVLAIVVWALRLAFKRPAPVVPAPSPSEPWAVVVARRVVVNLKSGRALDGVLVRRDGPLLFLKNAVLLEEGNEPAAIDGEAVVQAADIDFIQAL